MANHRHRLIDLTGIRAKRSSVSDLVRSAVHAARERRGYRRAPGSLQTNRVFALGLLRRFRVTLTLTTAVLIVGILTATIFRDDHQRLLDAVGMDLETLQSGRVWTMPSATLIQAEPGVTWHQLALMLVSLALLESQAGGMQALVTFFLADWISAPLTVLALWGLGAMGSDTAARFARTPDMGSSAAIFGALAAATVLLPNPLRVASVAGLLGYLSAALAFQRLDVALAHLLAALIGIAFRILLRRRRRRPSCA